MEQSNLSPKSNHPMKRPQVLYIDGCKVTVTYSGRNNPSAIKNIKDTLIAGGAMKKN